MKRFELILRDTKTGRAYDVAPVNFSTADSAVYVDDGTPRYDRRYDEVGYTLVDRVAQALQEAKKHV